jgi:hypothetical protein
MSVLSTGDAADVGTGDAALDYNLGVGAGRPIAGEFETGRKKVPAV